MALFIMILSCFIYHVSRQNQFSIGRRSAKIVVLRCSFWALVKALRNFILLDLSSCNFAKRWTPFQIIIKVFDHNYRQLIRRTHFSGCFWLLKRTNLLSKQNISFASNGDWKKPFASELRRRGAHIRWMEIRHVFTLTFNNWYVSLLIQWLLNRY